MLHLIMIGQIRNVWQKIGHTSSIKDWPFWPDGCNLTMRPQLKKLHNCIINYTKWCYTWLWLIKFTTRGELFATRHQQVYWLFKRMCLGVLVICWPKILKNKSSVSNRRVMYAPKCTIWLWGHIWPQALFEFSCPHGWSNFTKKYSQMWGLISLTNSWKGFWKHFLE